MPEPLKERVVSFDGARNVRDLGGIPLPDGAATRFGVVYRADGLSRLSDDDCQRLAAMRIRSIIDLRYDEERTRAPDRIAPDHPAKFFNRGFLPRGTLDLFEAVNRQGAGADVAFDLMCRNYSHMPFEHAREFRDVMHYLISADSAPHLVHCTSGKDRTGILCAFVLRTLGASVDDIIADYEMSNGDFQAVDIFGPNARADAVATVMAARAEYLLAALDAIDARHGSFARYLARELGYGATETEALRALLLA